MSVDLARLISKVDDTLTRSKVEGTRIGHLSASVPMAMRLPVTQFPEPDNWAHTGIRGAKTYVECELLAPATNLRHERRIKDGIRYE
jgi:hypothetical protein